MRFVLRVAEVILGRRTNFTVVFPLSRIFFFFYALRQSIIFSIIFRVVVTRAVIRALMNWRAHAAAVRVN